jgi:sulfoxide reductase catalytic subunit YedY
MTDSVKITPSPSDPITPALSAADDRIVMSDWLPPQAGIVPCICVGKRWLSILWTMPIGAATLVLAIALAHSLQHSGLHYGVPRHRAGRALGGFRLSLMVATTALPEHAVHDVHHPRRDLDLADHPRLYWTRDCTPGTEWFRFQHPVPEGRIWTSKDDSVTLPGWLGTAGLQSGIRSNTLVMNG